MSRLRQLGQNSIIYGIGGVLGRGVGIFLLPVYTRVFSPADFGTIEMLMTIANLIGAVIVMGSDSAQSFYFFKHKADGVQAQSQLVAAIAEWRILWGGVAIAVSTALSPIMNMYLFDSELQFWHFITAFVCALFLQLMTQAAELFRLLFRPLSFVVITTGHGLLTGACVLISVAVFRLGILGYLIGNLAACAIMMVVAWWMVRSYLSHGSNRRLWWPQILRFGWPMLPAALAYYIMSVADRWFVQYFWGPAELGQYALAAKLGLAMMLVVETFRKSWWPIAMDAMHGEDGPKTFRLISQFYFTTGTVAILGLIVVAPSVTHWLAAPAYFNAYRLIGIMGWQALFYGSYLIVSAGLWKAERTKLSAWLMGGAAVLNLFLNYTFVPLWSGVGAALATALTYLIWVATSYFIAESFWPVRLPVGRIGLVLMIGSAAHVLMLHWQDDHGALGGSALIAFGASLAVCLVMTDRSTWTVLSAWCWRLKKTSA